MKATTKRLTLATAAMLVASVACAQTTPSGLPNTLAWSAYGVGAGGYNQAVAIGNALKQKYGVNLRVLPGKNDISRTLPLREGQVQFSAHGIGAYMSQEGFYEFGAKDWGPQPVRVLLLNNSDQVLGPVTAKDAGIKTVADIKGKRVAWVIGAPALNQNITAVLAFSNLTWADVKKVEFGGFGASMDGLINNQVDVAWTSSISGKAYALAKSPRGISYPTISHADKEGWKRLQSYAPYYVPFYGKEGADLKASTPVETGAYPYPLLVAYAKQDPKLVKAMTAAMVDTFADYKTAAPGNAGWELSLQNFSWVIPYHDGAISYFKDKGLWTAEHEKNNAMLIKRQEVLATAWKNVKSRTHADEAAFAQDWMKTRAAALTQAGMAPVLTTW